jgi:hypothetical protein
VPSAAVLTFLGVWVILLGFGTVVVWRELLVLRARVVRYGVAVTDGPDVGGIARRQEGVPRTGVVIFVFGDCGPCHELAAGLGDPADWPGVGFVVGDGAEPGSSVALSELAARFPVVTGPAAAEVALAWRVNSGPLGLAIRDDVVQAKGYLRHADDVRLLVRAVRDAAGVVVR